MKFVLKYKYAVSPHLMSSMGSMTLSEMSYN